MRTIFALLIVSFIYSCENTNGNIKIDEKQLILNKISKESTTDQELNDYKEPEFMLKLQNQTDLSKDDYRNLIEFLINNTDESISENLGFLMFQYFKDKSERNNDFIKIVKNNEREKVYVILIQTMCIDIIDEDYNDIKEFFEDFPMFIDNNSDIIKKTYNFCMENK